MSKAIATSASKDTDVTASWWNFASRVSAPNNHVKWRKNKCTQAQRWLVILLYEVVFKVPLPCKGVTGLLTDTLELALTLATNSLSLLAACRCVFWKLLRAAENSFNRRSFCNFLCRWKVHGAKRYHSFICFVCTVQQWRSDFISNLIGANGKRSEGLDQSVSVLRQDVALLLFLLSREQKAEFYHTLTSIIKHYLPQTGVRKWAPITHSVCSRRLLSCSVPSRDTALCSSDAGDKQRMQTLLICAEGSTWLSRLTYWSQWD